MCLRVYIIVKQNCVDFHCSVHGSVEGYSEILKSVENWILKSLFKYKKFMEILKNENISSIISKIVSWIEIVYTTVLWIDNYTVFQF